MEAAGPATAREMHAIEGPERKTEKSPAFQRPYRLAKAKVLQ